MSQESLQKERNLEERGSEDAGFKAGVQRQGMITYIESGGEGLSRGLFRRRFATPTTWFSASDAHFRLLRSRTVR